MFAQKHSALWHCKKKGMKKMKRLFAFLLALVMVLGVFPATPANAADTTGTGTQSDPYVVYTYNDLKRLVAYEEAVSGSPERYIKLGCKIYEYDTKNFNYLRLESEYAKVTLDLAGYTLERMSAVTADPALFYCTKGVLTINDSGSNGKVIGTGMHAVYVKDTARVVINGGSFKAGITGDPSVWGVYVDGGELVINGGSFQSEGHYALHATDNDSSVELNGGTFYQAARVNERTVWSIYIESGANITITDCTVYGGLGYFTETSIWEAIDAYSSVSVGDKKIEHGSTDYPGVGTGTFGDGASVITIERPKICNQPSSGKVAPGKTTTVTWDVNIPLVKQALLTFTPGTGAKLTEIDPTARTLDLGVTPEGGYYQIRCYYTEDYFIASDKFTIEELPTYKVSFYVCSDTEPWQVQTVVEGETAIKIQDPERDGFIFLGWHAKVGSGYYLFDFSTPITRDIDLYDNWYTCVFKTKPAGGQVSPGQTRTVEWAVNFTPVKQVLLTHFDHFPTKTTEIPADTFSLNLGAAPEGGYYQIRSYYSNTGYITSDKIFIIEVRPAFTTQPVGGSVAAGETRTVNWELNFDPIKQVLITFSTRGVKETIIDTDARSLELGVNPQNIFYQIISYYTVDDYVTSDEFYIETAQLTAPTVTVTNDAATGKPKISWAAVEGAVKYEVYRSTSKNGTYVRGISTSKTSYTNSKAVAGKYYYYYVRAIDADGNYADSNIIGRTCDLAQPAITLGNVASSGKIKISWTAVEGATKYEVYRATSKNGTYSRLTTVTGTSVTNTKTDAGKTYYYKVRALCDVDAAASAYSAVKSRTCDLARTTVTLSNVASTGKIKISWTTVEGATKYEIYRATSKDGTYSRLTTVTGTSVTNTKTDAGKTYYYKVRALCDVDAATAAYSEVKSRTCDLPQPSVSITLNSGKPKVSWGKVEGAVSYKVYRATSQTGTYSLMKTTTSLSYTNTGATAGETYYYKVMAVCSNTAGNSAYSSIVSIKATK